MPKATVALPLIACVEIFGYTRFPPLNAALAILDFFSSTTAAFNLLPIRPLDASIVWRLLSTLLRCGTPSEATLPARGRELTTSRLGGVWPVSNRALGAERWLERNRHPFSHESPPNSRSKMNSINLRTQETSLTNSRKDGPCLREPPIHEQHSARCQHRTAAGRQLRSLASDLSSELCPHHAAPTRAANFREALTCNDLEFQRPQGVNNSLGALYNLLAEGLISPRRASVLAYISSLLLRTLPAIDTDLYPCAGRAGLNASGEPASQNGVDVTEDATPQEEPPKSSKPN